jgi:hypothetical protein
MRLIDAKRAPTCDRCAVERDSLRLVIELEPGDPVCGSAGVEGETATRFEGMLGFLALLDRLRAGEPTAGSREPPARAGGEAHE